MLAGGDPVPVKFGPRGTDPNKKDARFTLHTRRAVQSAIADLLVNTSCKRTSSKKKVDESHVRVEESPRTAPRTEAKLLFG